MNKNLKRVFADDPEMLRILEQREANELAKNGQDMTSSLLKELVKEKMKSDSSTKNIKIEFLKGDQGEEGPEGKEGPIGPMPIFGKDYFTEAQFDFFKEQATPAKGKDYFTKEEIESFKADATPKKGIHYFDGEDSVIPGPQGEPGMDGSPDTALEIASKLNSLSGAIDSSVIKGLPRMEDLIKELKTGKNRLEAKDILNMPAKGPLDQRWHGGGLSSVSHDATLTGLGTPSSPLSVVGGGGGSGTVTSVSVVSANGLAGTVATATTTPAITLSTTITGILKGNGTAISAATANTDYQSAINLTTTGSSGVATFNGTTLNIPNYSGGSGDVVGPASSVDNAVARFDGTTGKLIQNSAVTISDTLGDITAGKYNTVAITGSSTPVLNVTGTANVSGTNTGDQTTITGNAGTATALQTGRTIAITGDLAYTSPSFNGTSNVTAAGTLATVNSNVGSFTSANITVNAKGLITAASNGTSSSPGGANTQIQFNDSGSFGGDADFIWNKTTNTLTIGSAASNGTVINTDSITMYSSGVANTLISSDSESSFTQGIGTPYVQGLTDLALLTVSGSHVLLLDPTSGIKALFNTGTLASTDKTFTFPNQSGTFTVLGNTTTGSGSIVLATSPSLVTPNIGVAAGTSLAASGVMSTGTNTGTNGQITFFGSTSGSVTLKSAVAAGTGTNFTLPATNGSNTNVLQTDGSGNTSWVPAATGTVTSVTGTANRITSTGGATPAIDISASYVGQSSITTVGTLSAGAIPASLITAGTFGSGAYSFGTANSVTLGTIELGAATDTTIARVSAGVVSIEGNTIVVNASSPTLGTITTTGNIELGNASDTTLSRSSAGVLAVEGVVIPSISSTNILTNKDISKRLVSVNAPGATPSTNTDNVDIAEFTGINATITSMSTNLTGTPRNGQFFEYIFLDNGTARPITWGTSFANGGLVNLPTTTIISVVLRVLLQYQTIASLNKWVCVAVA